MNNEIFFMQSRDLLANHLKRISDNNPYYKKLFDECGVNLGDEFDYSEFCKIPIMDKEGFRNIQDEIYKVLDGKKIYKICTSGSTGKPLTIQRTMDDNVRMNYVLHYYRNRIAKNIIKEKAILFHYWYYKKVITSFDKRKYVFKNDLGKNFYRFGYFCLNDEVLKICIEHINNEKPVWILGQSSFMFELANYVIKYGGLNHQVKYIECNSEYLSTEEAIIIEKAFGIKPTSMYGSTELNAMAIQCRCGKMHIIKESVFVEIDNVSKNVIATSLTDYNTPFIRYKIGDIAKWDNDECSCGLNNPSIILSGFRANDFFVLDKGEKIEMWYFHESFEKLARENGIRVEQYSIIQYKDGVLFQVVCLQHDETIKNVIRQFLSNEVKDIFQKEIKIKVDFVEDIKPNVKTGKVRFFISKLDEMME
jgi:phenylacetate-CoA ligase